MAPGTDNALDTTVFMRLIVLEGTDGGLGSCRSDIDNVGDWLIGVLDTC